jgi:hypothetical protein
VCGVFQKDIDKSPHNIKLSLIISVMEIFRNFSRDNVKKASRQLQLRLMEVVTAECDFIR